MLLLGLMIPFFGTALGSAAVFFMRKKSGERIEKLLLGFASGVMLAASIWSLLLPSIEIAGEGAFAFVPAAAGLTFGVVFFILSDGLTKRLDRRSRVLKSVTKKTLMLSFAVTLHNIPEGMAVGITLAAATGANPKVTLASAFALAFGIALQNVPEGAIISLPLKSEGKSGFRAFLLGAASGAVEPLFGALTVLITGVIIGAMPYFLSFAAGAMLYVVVKELIPDSQSGRYSCPATLSLTAGFVIMMALDVAFG